MDTSHDGVVSVDEFVTFAQSIAQTEMENTSTEGQVRRRRGFNRLLLGVNRLLNTSTEGQVRRKKRL
jgi:hypothetical protein